MLKHHIPEHLGVRSGGSAEGAFRRAGTEQRERSAETAERKAAETGGTTELAT